MCCPASSAPPPSYLPSEFYIAGVCSSIFSCAMRYIFKVKQCTKPRCSYALDLQNSARPQTRHHAHVLGHETPQRLKASPLNPTQSSTIKHIRTAETFMSRRLRRTHTNLSIACPACRTHCVATWYRSTSSMIAGSPRKTEKVTPVMRWVPDSRFSSCTASHGPASQRYFRVDSRILALPLFRCLRVQHTFISSFLLTQAQPMPSCSHSHPDNIQPSTRTFVVH
ncbi:hypothetical protein B0H14DRAFT_3142856 [Mycena olivaceomarginata]|nr:hypothetical protein B0H14DRAFT_3142856 [Mycena olivaceomarginata]